MFSRFGVPETIVSNNGPQFTVNEFAKFVQFYSIEHITSSAYHPGSNGQVEMFLNSFKHGLKKINGEQNGVVCLQPFLWI